MTWRASVLTLFPEMFPGALGISLVGKALDEPIVVTDDFAQAYSGPLISLGMHQFRGVANPRELFAPAAGRE